MKITRKQLRKIIREQTETSVEILDDVGDAEIRNAWPDKVTYDGQNIFNMIYNNSRVMDGVYDAVENGGYGDPNEVYLGYDLDSGNFIMGFDAFEEYENNWGDREYGEMEGVFVSLRPHSTGGADGERSVEISPGRVELTVPGGVYGSGAVSDMFKREYPGTVDIRLD